MTREKFQRLCAPQQNGCVLYRPGEYAHHRYGEVWVPEAGVRMSAPRAALLWAGTAVPDGMVVMHSCDTPRCVNINHLRIGTQAENMADRDAKGRYALLGSKSPLAKLDEEKVLEIRAKASAGETARKLSVDFQVSLTTVVRILNRITWRHV